MIRVPPATPSATCASALETLKNKFSSSSDGTTKFWAKNRSALKEAAAELDAAFRSKCGYCEAFPGGVSYLHIDHFLPKETHSSLMYDWSNFVNSCQICNHKKHNKEDARLLSPLTDSPEQSIEFKGAAVFPKDDRGEYTIRELALDRPELETLRRDHLLTVVAVARLVVDPALDEADLVLFADFAGASTQPDAPFSAAARHVLGELPAPDASYRDLAKIVFERLAELAP